MSDDRDHLIEQRLRDALSATADNVQPGGDGLMRIQQRIGERRSQQRWLRPVLVAGSVVVVAAIAVGGVAIARHGGNNGSVGVGDKGPSTTAKPVSDDGFPTQGFFPFATATEESAWEQQFANGHSPWISDPTAVATSWVQNYLKQSDVSDVSNQAITATTADVTLSRKIPSASHGTTSAYSPVTVVHLVKFNNAWIVTGASSAQATSSHGGLTISSPAPGSTGNSPLTVDGPGYGADERATIEVRDAETPTLLGQASTGMFGNGNSWSATVPFQPSDDGFGVIVATVPSAADGGVGEIVAQKVVFTQASPAAVTAGGFYGVQGGVIERFSAGGTPQGPVTGSDSHGTVAEVHDSAGSLYFTAGTSRCPSALYSMAIGGGSATTVAAADAGYAITGFDVSPAGRLVYFESGCGPQAGKGKLVFPAFGHGPQGRAIDFPSLPPVVGGDPVWEPDGVHVDAFVRTGMQGYLARYDATSGTDPQPSTNACPGYDVNNGMPGAITTAPDGTLYIAVQTGTSMQVLRCAGNRPTVELSVSKNGTPSSVSVDPSGKVLLADVDGEVWSGKAGGLETALTSASGVTSVTW
ncbi:MAG TPA: Gmad2 immunoglobulin-like domain-containing protein [Mycobacteriales bacterium]|nr:Gmad2 immunoglobulin-like domain-containing protein [Mycobacteriales bacterium]